MAEPKKKVEYPDVPVFIAHVDETKGETAEYVQDFWDSNITPYATQNWVSANFASK